MYLLLLSNLTEAGHYSWGATVLASLFWALDRAVKLEQTEIDGCLLLLQSWVWDHIKCIAPKIHHLFVEEVQELGFPLARRWSRLTTKTNIASNLVRLIRVILDRLHMIEVHFLIFILSIFFYFLFELKYVTIIIYVLPFLWTPYGTLEIRSFINYVEVSMIVRAKVPLMFCNCGRHLTNKVMRWDNLECDKLFHITHQT